MKKKYTKKKRKLKKGDKVRFYQQISFLEFLPTGRLTAPAMEGKVVEIIEEGNKAKVKYTTPGYIGKDVIVYEIRKIKELSKI